MPPNDVAQHGLPPPGNAFMMQGGMQPGPTPQGVPDRVLVAMRFLQFCAIKTSKSIVVAPDTAHAFDGEMLHGQEELAMEAACGVMRKYLDGELKLSDDERIMMHPFGPGATHQCFHCIRRGQADPGCRMCNGSGVVIVFAARNSGA